MNFILRKSSAANATTALTTIDTAINTIANTRSSIGAAENRIDHRIDYLTDISAITKTRLSKIEDSDFALETAKLTKSQIMTEAATSMLAQANVSSKVFLKLLG